MKQWFKPFANALFVVFTLVTAMVALYFLMLGLSLLK